MAQQHSRRSGAPVHFNNLIFHRTRAHAATLDVASDPSTVLLARAKGVVSEMQGSCSQVPFSLCLHADQDEYFRERPRVDNGVIFPPMYD